MNQMTLADVQQKFEQSILMYNKKPVLFQRVGEQLKTCRIYDLMAQKEEHVEFDENLFSPPIPRIGMVNIEGEAVYMKRVPMRRWKLGLAKENLQVCQLPVQYEQFPQIQALLLTLRTKELAQALLKKYPTLKTAISRVKRFAGHCAFDKQFAVTSDGYLIYKTQIVGHWEKESLVFDKGYEHLQILVKQ